MGGYLNLAWTRNEVRVFTNIVDFGETYVVDNTSAADLGLYQVEHTPLSGQQSPPQNVFTVIEPGIAISSTQHLYLCSYIVLCSQLVPTLLVR